MRAKVWLSVGLLMIFGAANLGYLLYQLFAANLALGGGCAMICVMGIVSVLTHWEQLKPALIVICTAASFLLFGLSLSIRIYGLPADWIQKKVTPSIRLNQASSMLHEAARHGDKKLISQALKSGEGVNSLSSDGWTPLMEASAVGQTEAVKALLKAGADPQHQDPKGRTALSLAKSNGRFSTAAVLESALDRK